MTPEGKVKASVKEILRRFPKLYSFWPVPSGFGPSGLDCYICYFGKMLVVETKAPGKRLTPRQNYYKRELVNAGARVFVIDGTAHTDTVTDLEAHLCAILEWATHHGEVSRAELPQSEQGHGSATLAG